MALGRLIEGIPADWRAALAEAIEAPTFRHLTDELAAERARTDSAIYPPEPLVFNALRLTPLDSVRVVILGQDPYHGFGQAHGLAFSAPRGVTPPPSLRNILAELGTDLQLPGQMGGSLEPWARHGVLLLNTVMTVSQGIANSHQGKGWEPFTDAIIRVVAAKQAPVAFLLWGRAAQRNGGSSAGGMSSSRHHTPLHSRPRVAERHSAHRGRSAPRTPSLPRLDSRRSTGA